MATSARVDDYLSDKIQTLADLETINDLLAKVREQQVLLKDQLATAKTELQQAETASKKQETSLNERIAQFQHDQASIDKRIQSLTQSNVSDDAVRIFESRMQKLERLKIAEGYVEILEEVETLVSDARANLHEPSHALKNYSRVRSLLSNVQRAQQAADEAAPHLVDQITGEVDGLYKILKEHLEKDLQATLTKMQWPKKEMKLSESIVQTWSNQVSLLLDLQEANTKTSLEGNIMPAEATSLLPLEVMVQPLSLRFQYHFYGDRPTNRLDKPEYFFSHTLDLLEQHGPFLSQFLQPILDERIQTNELLDLFYTDAVSSFITALLPTVLAKCLSILPQISQQPQLLSHFVHEVMSFDTTLRDSWGYTPVPGLFADWRGLTWDILNKHGYFNTWLEVEKSFALSRYKKIRDNPDSNQIDYDTFESSRTKPTKGAIRVIDLLETVTERYKSLPSFSHKIRFFLDIQLTIFDEYIGHLRDAYQAYLMSSHSAGRLLQGGGPSKEDVMGVKGLETLVKIFGSAEYLEKKMADWSEEVFFLELWEELEDRAKRGHGHKESTVGQNLSIAEIASKTSSTIQSDVDAAEDSGALFDEISKTYQKLREGAETEIVRALETLARNALKPFARVSWISSHSTSDIYDLTPSPAIDTLLSTLSSLLSFLSKTLATSPLRRILRPLAQTIQKDIHDTIIMKHDFSAGGALQLKRDIIAIQQVIDTNGGESARTMKKLDQEVTLLSLPIRSSSSSRKQDETNDDDGDEGEHWGLDDSNDLNTDNDDGRDIETEVAKVGLWEAERAIFASNESARKVLETMGLDHLTETEARNVIRRRVELNA